MRYKILIISLLLGGFAIVAASVSMSIMKRDIQVEDSPYEAGLRYDETIRTYAELGWTVDMPESVRAGDKVLKIKLSDKKGNFMADAAVNCLISKCARYDVRRSACSSTSDGYYECPVIFDGPGCRNVKVSVGMGADNMVIDRKIIVER